MTAMHVPRFALLAAGTLLCPGLACAQQSENGAPLVTATGNAPAAAAPAKDDDGQIEVPAASDNSNTAAPLWSAEASGGISQRDDGPDGSWQTLSLSRQVGKAYVRAGFMRYRGTLVQSDTALPSTYYVGTLGAGGNFHNWVTDVWGSFGIQDYGRISSSLGSRDSTGAKSSDYEAFGADFGKIIPFAKLWYLTATVTGSYAHGKLLRPAPDYSGLTDAETDEPTWSASGTLRLDRAFGNHAENYVGLSVTRAWSSNAVSDIRYSSTEYATATSFATLISSNHIADSWFEVGASTNLQVTHRLYLDLFATRSFEAKSGATTSVGITLRRAF
ncbi:autotransporter outer membrane beta-barrel domain-containing protein [Novosphingobium sp. 9]|uniref:autotransporter outer membrane beta-barrel domain-containing protein n=1 Tax=Novosphingobium sp. 9 TaxID=2025349 RepID=UPI0021B6AF10|nr:autotransporter outer membrane beta-barrel domain-containing protein [Novosphingobium sp. 9]